MEETKEFICKDCKHRAECEKGAYDFNEEFNENESHPECFKESTTNVK